MAGKWDDVGLAVEVNDDYASKALDQAISLGRDPSSILDEIGMTLESLIDQRMRDQVDPDGQAWAELAESTQERRGSDAHILRHTGVMANSLGYTTHGDAVHVGFAQPYTLFHEFGAPANKMPRRGLLMSDPETGELATTDQDMVIDVIQRNIEEVFCGRH